MYTCGFVGVPMCSCHFFGSGLTDVPIHGVGTHLVPCLAIVCCMSGIQQGLCGNRRAHVAPWYQDLSGVFSMVRNWIHVGAGGGEAR